VERWARRRVAPAVALRSRIVLACAAGTANKLVAERFGVTPQTVAKWRNRFVQRRLDGLADKPRPGAPAKVSDDLINRLIAKTIEDTSPTGEPWSARSLARAIGLSHSTILRIWNAHGIRPERSRGRRLSSRRIGQIVPLRPRRSARP